MKYVFLGFRMIVAPFYLFVLFGVSFMIGWVAILCGLGMIILALCGRDQMGHSIENFSEFKETIINGLFTISMPIVIPFIEVYQFLTGGESIID